MTAVFPQSSESSQSPQLADDIKLRDIIDSLPKEVFLKNSRKAWTKLVVNVICVILGYWAVAVSPWYLLPLSWV
ncbi:MAG: hypothetical protein RLZZ74_2258, partial [Cyanobacteriota bacterium]